MNRLLVSLVFVAFIIPQALSQSKEDGRAAFDRLVAAHDSEIMDAVKNNNLVCFADKNPEWLASDRFLVVVTSEPQESAWINAEENDPGKTIYGSESALGQQYGLEEVFMWENEDNVLWVGSGLGGRWRAVGHYAMRGRQRRWVGDDIGPVFRYSIDDDKAKALGTIESIAHDSNSFSATKKYDNKAKGTTEWNLSIRLSTGRYQETWEHGDSSQSLGRCYRAKTLSKPAVATEKPKTKH